jgi:uncharacterized glyoxalase superfamily protein PhnB
MRLEGGAAMTPQVLHTRHVLAVQNLAVSARYYKEQLGFVCDFTVDGWEFLSLGGFKVMLGECPNEMAARETGDHSYFAHVLVTDVDALYRDVCQRGATILFAPKDQSWGLREFGVVTPDGHRILFGQQIA